MIQSTPKEIKKIADYGNWVKREMLNTAADFNQIDQLNYQIGMAEEAGEILKHHGKASTMAILRDNVDFQLELGDYLWYWTAWFHATNSTENPDSYYNELMSINVKTDSYFEPQILVCDQLSLLGLHKKVFFLDREFDLEAFDKYHRLTTKSFFGMFKHFNYDLSKIMSMNKGKLENRYPGGRSSNIKITINHGK